MYNIYNLFLISHNDKMNATLIIALNNVLVMSKHHIIVRDFNLHYS
jgi:hypothetical protein